MKSFALVILWLALQLLGVARSNEELDLDSSKYEDDVQVSKRSVLQFYTMIRSQTGRDPKDYMGYGCWCGYGGKGRPVDEVDRCCQQHDWCYNRLYKTRRICGRYEIYHKNYYYSGLKCYKGWLSSRCGRSLCACDVAAVKCFKRNRFNNRYKDWNKKSC
ncbi:phospholipase A2 A2-actitoxin-Cgg2a-like [Actinia tenebrosa]|uniref:Phospholipase A2 n=1 Tax=Actinia tenebrosa TaxID=6105 RepID=A0A6P8HFV9_ACTTE|nr:phospholipase A2 A2-actitoxin-Cgg2a-like [Actinia tenebrosa]